ncbi:cbb3-type cytochrome oxidase assembly protein CcoS [Candidatus Marinarcus aquaticus]|uniref:Cbb3-type cytochrome oxidase assembly protein CcoS n=1 Tax=Candidatus Marinarcus aquaticus TaxID=2044504 RepID=A0A4V1LPA5_9BACT|nr:cbb3-type cytochrome oxidase assembly protein CcoS [Candidatus Marinarcus aquaticus]RXJ60518.1 cbb3-type cytochrome oxidase assembly protein CcoS [Candidatus Marinarcus aquaticus]
MNDVLTMMLVVGLLISFSVLAVFVWGAKSGQFDDSRKMMDGLLFDSEEDLNDAISREKKREASIKDKESETKSE